MELEDWLEIEAYERLETGAGPVAISRFMPPKEKFGIRLYGTEWTVGQLTIRTRQGARDSGSGSVARTNHPLDLAAHPRRGVVNARVFAFSGDEMSESELRAFVAESAERLQLTTDALRTRVRRALPDGPAGEIWSGCALPIEPVYVMHGACADIDPKSVDIDPSRVIRSPWKELPERLDALMPELAIAEREDIAPVETLIETVRTLTPEYIDHESYIETWEVVADQLFEDDCDAAA